MSIVRNGSRLEYLDALRGFAVLGVLITHACGLMGPQTGKWGVDFASGVQLFYMVSAYTLFWVQYNRHEHEKYSVLKFYIRRFFRISPLFYSVLTLYIFGSYYFNGSVPDKYNILATVFFVNGAFPQYINSIIGVEWSVAVEVTFYLIAPFLFRVIISSERAVVLLVASLIIAEYSTLWLFAHSELYSAFPPYLMFWFPAQFPAFAGGVLAFFLSQTQLTQRSARLLLIVSCVWILMVYGGGDVRFFPHRDLMTLGFAGVLIAFSSFSFRIFVNKVTEYLGKISFSIYLLHLFIMMRLYELVVVPLGLSSWIGAFVLFVGTLGLATPLCYLTYRYIETPGIKIGRAVIGHINNIKKA